MLLLAFTLRLVARFTSGEADFLENSYFFYRDVARTFLSGAGLCLSPGEACAMRVPVYPLFLAPFLATAWFYPGVVATQSAIGAALAWVAWKIGDELFNRHTGWLAAAMVAFNPYAVVHDTALQETALVNLLMALSVWLLLRSRRPRADVVTFGAGVVLALATLTTARVATFVPFALLWATMASGPAWRRRVRQAALVALPVLILVGGWTFRNWRVVGAPVLTTEAGESLWAANDRWTFSNFPVRTIDLSLAESYRHLTPAQTEELAKRQDNDVARDRLLFRWGVEYIATHPAQTVWSAARKVWAAASGQLSPARGAVVQASYGLVFSCVHLLAAVGLWRSRRLWRVHTPVYLLFISFAITTALFWAHTSHKSYLDAVLFVYAASVLTLALRPRRYQVPAR